MHRNLKVALGGAALSVGVVVGLPTVALANTLDCTNAQIRADYPKVCITPPSTSVVVTPPNTPVVTPPNTPVVTPPNTPVVGGVEAPGIGGEAVGGGTTGGGTTGGGTAGGGTAGGSTPVGGGAVSSGRGAVESLPFTGDEILVMGIAGAATLAAGAALTVAGRRRGATTA